MVLVLMLVMVLVVVGPLGVEGELHAFGFSDNESMLTHNE
jgi:hypothetical protein